ncbi:dTDP-4-dehydrorhamnose reductase [Halomonas sp. DN3]|uniref:dTDP-4-dehydrorhamnose reductase n=1 Tax=Halomonas sp. DN3 TaxID=2953657 RepID=UPI00209D64D2|nr:dTDP-4-dehydrorhamnose reductase [Halomonas sp. DN3]USZ49667.1 dTDP-4-dehydrorhamnose reductase [Halomonas sp. DN3]
MSGLLLGATGQVGHELRKSLAIHLDLHAPDRGTLDLTDLDAVKRCLDHYRPQWVINAAAYTAVDQAETDTATAFRLNAELPSCLARYCAEHGALLTHYSSDYVYPGDGIRPWTEESPTDPLSRYGQSKLAGDEAVLASGCAAQIFRTSWVYSARGGNFMKTMLRLGRERSSLSIVDDQVGAPTPARLIADVTLHAWQVYRSRPELTGLYHLAPRGFVSWYDFAREIFRLARLHGLPLMLCDDQLSRMATKDYPTPAKRPPNSRLSVSRLENAFDISLPDWRGQLSLTMKDYLR